MTPIPARTIRAWIKGLNAIVEASQKIKDTTLPGQGSWKLALDAGLQAKIIRDQLMVYAVTDVPVEEEV